MAGTPRRRIRQRSDHVLALIGLTAQSQQPPHQLSAASSDTARDRPALVHDHALIIADEPNGNLSPLRRLGDPASLLRFDELGVTVMMATHDAEVVTALRKRWCPSRRAGSSATRSVAPTTARGLSE